MALAQLEFIAGQHVMKRHRGSFRIRDLDAYRRFPGDRRFDADVGGFQSHGQFIGEAFDLADTDAHFRLQFKPRHRGAYAVVNHLRMDAEAIQCGLDQGRLLCRIGRATTAGFPGMEKGKRRELVLRDLRNGRRRGCRGCDSCCGHLRRFFCFYRFRLFYRFINHFRLFRFYRFFSRRRFFRYVFGNRIFERRVA